MNSSKTLLLLHIIVVIADTESLVLEWTNSNIDSLSYGCYNITYKVQVETL